MPEESISKYKQAEEWKKFTNIQAILDHVPGDVNIDSEVNIADVNAVINIILSGNSDSLGDVNGDGEVNIADINAVIDIILRH